MVELIYQLRRVNVAAQRSYARIAAHTSNAVLRYVLNEIAQLKSRSLSNLPVETEPDQKPALCSCTWEHLVMATYTRWERCFVDDDTDSLTAEFLGVERLLLEVVERTRIKMPPDESQTEFTALLAYSREVCTKLEAMRRYGRNIH